MLHLGYKVSPMRPRRLQRLWPFDNTERGGQVKLKVPSLSQLDSKKLWSGMKYKRVYSGVLAFGLLALLAWGIYGFFDQQSNRPTAGALPPVVTQPVIPTDYDRVRDWFGPWTSEAAGSTGAPALVMLFPDGHIEVSSWTVPVDDSWLKTDLIQLTNVSYNDRQVSLRTGGLISYKVGFGQPFVLKGLPQQVFAFRRTSTGYDIVSISAEQARKLGHKL